MSDNKALLREKHMSHDLICVNFPVDDLARSIAFYTQLGFEPHAVFRGPDCQCMIISNHIHIMMHLASSLKQFTPKSIANPRETTGAILSLNCESKQRVNQLVALAVANGGATYDAPQDLGFIYTHGFTDVDGNVWRVNWLNPKVAMSG
jgi:predicted lactoylglutathione lyase